MLLILAGSCLLKYCFCIVSDCPLPCWLLCGCCVLQYGWTPLHIAAKYGGVIAVRMLLCAGADKDAETQVREACDMLACLMSHPAAACFRCL